MERSNWLAVILSVLTFAFFLVWNPADGPKNLTQVKVAYTATNLVPITVPNPISATRAVGLSGTAVLASLQEVPQSVTNQFTSLQSCATVRIVVEQAYSESAYGHPVAEVKLPFGEVARALFAGAGLRLVDDGDADVVVTIRSAGEARATTGEEKFYVWARVVGTVSIVARNQLVVEANFDGSSPGLTAGTPLYEWQKKPQSAPFIKAFADTDHSYLETILRLTARIYGPKALVGAIGEFRQIRMDGNNGMPSLTRVLGETGGPAAVEPLIDLLKDPSAQVMAAKQLGEIREPRAVEVLITLLSAPAWQARCAAAEALVQIGDGRAIQPLVENLRDPEVGEGCVAEALAKFKDERVTDALIAGLKGNRDVKIGSARALRTMADSKTVQPLIEVLSDPDDWVKAEAAESLGAIPDPQSIDPLLAALNVIQDAQLRGKITSSLVKILRVFPDSRAVEPIISICKRIHDDTPSISYVRIPLIDAIAPIADERVFEFLMECLKHSDYASQEAAANALRSSKDPRAVDVLLATLQETETRRLALLALGGFDQPRVIQALLAALIDPDEFVREAAASSLEKIKNPDTVPQLIALLRDKVAYGYAAKALRGITGQDFGFDYKKWSQWWKRLNNKGK